MIRIHIFAQSKPTMLAISKRDPTFISSITTLLKEGKSYHHINRELKISRACIKAYSQKLGFDTEHTFILKKHTLDLEYFKNIDTPEKAYVLGLLYADGCNTRRGLQIALVEEDKEVVEFVKSQLGASEALKFIPAARTTWKNKWNLSIKSMDLSKQLTSVGIHPNKSLTITFPSWLKPDLVSHFIRGYFDGDGSIWKSSPTSKSYQLAFSCSSPSFLESLKNYFIDELAVTFNVYKHPVNNGSSLQSGKQDDVRKVLRCIYNNSSFSMMRKKKKAEAFLGGNL